MGLTVGVWDAFASTLKLSDKLDQATTGVSK